jgi:hypothetical protein
MVASIPMYNMATLTKATTSNIFLKMQTAE